ncbi:MAG: phosphatase [Cyanobacteria bacterium NC_groundwater_1444_Ag_S-0.65um_54_12]|nr:phosphatase [Cyanobacteria bacterium NC_groundwater_1444_Ag_S-0.65um_54_12]
MNTIMMIERLAQQLVEWGFAGEVPNSRAANLRAINNLLAGEPFYTFGIHLVEQIVGAGQLDRVQLIQLMAQACGCNDTEEFLRDPGYIGPEASAKGIFQMATWLHEAARQRWRVSLGTGHPGSMLGCYVRLAEWLRCKGCPIAAIPVGEMVGIDWWVDEIGGVVITSDGCGILHGHSTRSLESVLGRAAKNKGCQIDLVIGDHGYAGAAVNAELPCLSVMDTNDPALAVAAYSGATNLVVVPLYDNRPNGFTKRLADLLIEIVEGAYL